MRTLILTLFLGSCCHSMGGRAPADIKIYSVQPNTSYCRAAWCQGKVGLVRSQDREVIPFTDDKIKGFVAVSPEDYKRIYDRCPK